MCFLVAVSQTILARIECALGEVYDCYKDTACSTQNASQITHEYPHHAGTAFFSSTTDMSDVAAVAVMCIVDRLLQVL